jgi:putative addiction module component (TIGR02574 family)
MLPSGTAARLKNGSCKMMTISNALERQGPRNVFEIPKSLLSGSIHPISRIMVATIEDLKQLPISEKIQLVEDLWDSIAAETSPIGLSPQHIAELDYRLDALEKNPSHGTPWSTVREKILASL